MSKKPLIPDALTHDRKVRRIGIVAFPGAEVLDITGPMEVFTFAKLGLWREKLISTKEAVYAIEVLAEKPGPVKTLSGLQIIADRAYGDITNGIDTLLIPGGDVTSVLADRLLVDWIRAMAPRVRRLASVCTGAFLLAESGLLDGRQATTHWDFCNQLACKYPLIRVEADRIFVQDGSIFTSAGITSGIDLALALVEEDWGRELALFVARYLVVFLKRPGGQSQFSAYLTSEAVKRPDLRDIQAWILDHPAEDFRIEAIAERMAMSPRNFARVFLTETGMTPAKFVERARIDAARYYLESTELPIETVADKSGFRDPERMRRTFHRLLGVSAQDYRARFKSATRH